MIAFQDTLAFVAAVDRRDQYHAAVVAYLSGYAGKLITTEWVVVESLDSLAEPIYRSSALKMIDRLRSDPGVEIIGFETGFYSAGFQLFRSRPDKNWSLTDCISFVVMEERKLTDALTADHHFRQAGFNPIFEKVP